MLEKVKAARPPEFVLVDRNGDGKHEEAWFIDPSPRHTPANRPILVRAIDEDGDLDADGRPDLDSDLYVADWKADGSVDVVLDYQDNDADNDLDEMGMYFFMKHHPFFGDDVLRVWWGRDDGDDNLLWYDEDYTYYQGRCQYRCHFSGDETFVAFGLKADSTQWLSAYENPFLFYDEDGDHCSEVVLRIEGKADAIRAIRYSFDADDDAHGRQNHDYDFSITAHADENKPVTIPPDLLESTKLRGIPTQGWLRRDKARAFVENATWWKVMLTWDELNANSEENVAHDPNERWEGVITHGTDEFKQVGGPPCSTLNKRFELSLAPKPPLKIEYVPSDGRFHLVGATRGWMDVDYNLDGKVDSKYEWLDADGDGRFDRRNLDTDADGRLDFPWAVKPDGRRDVPLDFKALAALWPREIRRTLDASQQMLDAEFTVIGKLDQDPHPTSRPCPVVRFFQNELASWMPQTRLGERIRSTPAGALFYSNYSRDRLLQMLWKPFGEHGAAAEIYQLSCSGKHAEAAEVLLREWAGAAVPRVNAKAFGSFKKRIAVVIDNGGGPQRDDWPVVVRVAALKTGAADFNPENCLVVAPNRWVEWRPVPHQIDTIDPTTGPELSFIADVPADSKETWYVYYSPSGGTPTTYPARTATAQDWVPPNIGWESGRAGYRAYWGQFDFFGKKTDRLIYPTIGKVSYHNETDWGIDALSTGKTGGSGGITLYRGEQAYPVWNPVGQGSIEFQKRELTAGPVRAAIEITARRVLPDQSTAAPDVTMCCLIYARRQETEVRVTAPAGCDVAPGLNKLKHEQTVFDKEKGCFGTWGYQLPEIGEIGMAILFDPAAAKGLIELPEQRNIRLAATAVSGAARASARYWLIGDWRRGRQYPVAPTVQNWRGEVSSLAHALVHDVRVTVGSAETVAAEAAR